MTITAQDQWNNTVTAYVGTVALTDSTGTIAPATSGGFVAGVWSGQVTITKAQAGVTITATGEGKVGISNAFDVNPGPLDHFAFGTISSPQTVGIPFTVTITAQDQWNNTVTAYVGTVALTDTTGTISPATSGSFVAGVWSGQVTITKAQAGVVITATGEGKIGISNAFGVNPGPLDHFAVSLPLVLREYTPPHPDLSTSTKVVDRDFANAGETLHYTIELRNTGTRAADVYFSDPIPDGTTLTGTVEGGVYRSGKVEWSGTLDVDAIHTVAFGVCLDEGVWGEIVNVATIDDGYHESFQRSASTQVMVTNPGFETGDFTGWQHGGKLAQSVSGKEPHTGSYSALLGDPSYACEGGVPVGRAWLEQTFIMPPTGVPVLSFWYRIHTHDHLTWTDGTLGDSFDVYINSSMILQDNYDNYPGPAPGCSNEQDLGWEHFS